MSDLETFRRWYTVKRTSSHHVDRIIREEGQHLGRRVYVFDILALLLRHFFLRGVEHFRRWINAGDFSKVVSPY